MSKFSIIARWVAATPTAILGFLIGVVLMRPAYRGEVASIALISAMAFATLLGAQVGVLIAPRRHRMAACYIFIGMAIAAPAVDSVACLVEHAFTPNNVFEVIGSILGGIAVWFNTRILRMFR